MRDVHAPAERSAVRTWSVSDAADGLSFMLGALLAIWLAWAALVRDVVADR